MAIAPAGTSYDCSRDILETLAAGGVGLVETRQDIGGDLILPSRAGGRLSCSIGIVCNGSTKSGGQESQSDESDELHDAKGKLVVMFFDSCV